MFYLMHKQLQIWFLLKGLFFYQYSKNELNFYYLAISFLPLILKLEEEMK